MPKGYTFGGRHIHEFKTEMTGMPDIPLMPPVSNMSETQAGKDGGWDFGVQYDPKIITVDQYIWTDTRTETQNLARELAGHLNPRLGAQELIFDHEPDKMYMARLNSQFKVEEIIKLFNDFTLEFICYDPFTYSVIEETEVITTSGQIVQNGTHVAKPILVIEHRGGSATIENTTPDGQIQSVVFASNTPAGQFTIDMKEGTVLFGSSGGDKYIESIKWFELAQGTNEITHGINIDQVTFKYRHTWL